MAGADSLIEQARGLDAKAREHKRQADRHRQAARQAREQQAEIERQCARLGITVTYDQPNGAGASPWPQTQSSTSRR